MNSSVPPPSPTRFEDLPSSPVERRTALADNFGQWLFWIRNEFLEAVRQFIRQEASREKLGNIRRRVYDEIAAMPEEHREAALELARKTVDGFLESMLWSLGDEGMDSHFDESHAYRFRIHIEILELNTCQVVEDTPVNRGERFFGRNFGRWLNQFAAAPSRDEQQ